MAQGEGQSCEGSTKDTRVSQLKGGEDFFWAMSIDEEHPIS